MWVDGNCRRGQPSLGQRCQACLGWRVCTDMGSRREVRAVPWSPFLGRGAKQQPSQVGAHDDFWPGRGRAGSRLEEEEFSSFQ